jgi:hypothetical protein
MTMIGRYTFILALATIIPFQGAFAKSWVGGTGDWHTASNWSPAGVPSDGEAVTSSVGNAVIMLTNQTAFLGSFSMMRGRLVFSNWTTRLTATNITINAGTVTVANAFGDLGMSNRVWFVCANAFTLNPTGRIDVSNLGYLPSSGPGKGTPDTGSYCGGGGHGGKGGVGYYNGGSVYDSLTEPGAPGSGGGGGTNIAGSGGGVVRIEAGGTATVNGLIAANGMTATNTLHGGGGAGGTICIVAASFNGSSNGLLQANGGVGGNWRPGSGGGGRIAVIGGTVDGPLLVRFSTAPGATSTSQSGVLPFGSTINLWADWGTVYIADTNVLSGMPQNNQFTKTVLQVGSATNWTVGQLTLTNNSFRLIPEGFQLNVTGNLTIATNAELGVRGSIACGGDLLLTNNGILSVYSGPTNGLLDYGSLVNVGGDLRISGFNTWLRPYASPTNGGGVLLRMRNLAITQTNAGINASGCGFAFGQGPGAGSPNVGNAGGGGYGGRGCSVSTNGLANGNPYAPLLPGSGGGIRTDANRSESSGFGGGVIRVDASDTVTLNGNLIAQGGIGYSPQWGSGGAGGGILIACSNFEGTANAVLDAKGGNSGRLDEVGGGGGGRIAVCHGKIVPERRAQLLAGSAEGAVLSSTLNAYQGSINVSTGIGYLAAGVPAENGTAWFISFPTTAPPVAIISSHTNGSVIPTNSFTIGVEAFSDGYTVTQVFFYADGALLGGDASAPYNWDWSAVPWGVHVLTVVAHDDMGQCSTSAPVQVIVSKAVRSWTAGAGDWFDAANWDPEGVPGEGDLAAVTMPGAVVLLTNETADLSYFQMSAGRLVFSNWTTKISANGVGIEGGTVTVANAFYDTEMSNRVWIVCTNDFTLTAPGRIDVSNLGYTNASGPGRGTPVALASYGGGGGHGGKGGVGYYNGGPAVGSLMEPYAPGSGGGSTITGGCGGGVVLIDAGGVAAIAGSILANGQTAVFAYGGGGAGGSICLKAGSFTGTTNGLLSANGGGAGSPTYSGGGGGGRIALLGGSVSVPLPIRFSTAPGMPTTSQAGVLPYGSTVNTWADWGTVYIADASVLAGMPLNNQFTKTVLQAGNATNWTLSGLTLTNNSFRLSPDGFQLTVSGDLTVGANAELGIRGSIACGGDLVLTNNGLLTIYSGPTNGAVSYGAIVDVASNLVIAGNNAWLVPNADPVTGGGVLLRMQNLAVTQTNAGINASGRGFAPGRGPGKGGPSGQYSGGGGHGGGGGKGASSTSIGGVTNGNPYAPIWPGSGGGLVTVDNDLTNGTGYGGGTIRVEASNCVTLQGILVAQGGRGRGASTHGAGGAGGAIWILCQAFTGGVDSVLDVAGGSFGQTSAGSGGGGRIAVWEGSPPKGTREALMAGAIPRLVTASPQSDSFEGTISVTNGPNGGYLPYATPGTVLFLEYTPPPTGTVIIVY